MRGYLLDTSICVAIFRGNRHVAAKMNEVGKGRCFITQIVVAELTMVTHNVKHFSHIEGIEIEDWVVRE